ncbi:MAG: acyl-CoA desaturase [Pseudomonadota bacterium]
MIVDASDEGADASAGRVRWSATKSLWFTGHALVWMVLGSLYFSWSAVALFLLTSAITLCAGHSLGMHRKFIHNSYQCSQWLERLGVYFGTLVGLGGPRSMLFTHDVRDWAQRQPECHPFLAHQSAMLRDFWWQLHCTLSLTHEPRIIWPSSLARSSLYDWLQRTSMLQQLPWALLFYGLGGWGWVAWGICGRITISILGHWLIGYFAHNQGHRSWHVEGAAVQGHNVHYTALITFGECWHNNHHAFPGSAKLGLLPGQCDPGWWVLCFLSRLGLVWDMKVPERLDEVRDLSRKSRPDTRSERANPLPSGR